MKKMMIPEFYYSCYKETNDDWFGSFSVKKSPVNLVKLSLIPVDENKSHRIVCSGNDDYSLSRDFNHDDDPCALLVFLELLKMKTLDQDYLQENGFTFSN